MWVDAEGVCHTVAVPDPTELMSDDFRESLDHLLGEQAGEVFDVISEQEDQFYQEHLANMQTDAQEDNFEGVAPPSGLLGIPIATSDELRHCILAVDRRWRLDAIVALDDYLS